MTGCVLRDTFVQFPLDLPLPAAQREKGRSVSQSSIQGKACARCPAAQSRPFAWKKKERKEGIGHGRGERAPCGGTGENKHGWKERRRNQNKQIPGGKRSGTEKELARPRLGPGAIPHPRNESLPSLGGHVQALFWETEAGSAPAARRGRASAGRSSQGRVLPVPAGDGRRRRCHGQGWQRPGAQAGGRTPQPRVVGSCQTQSSLTPSQTPLTPVSPSLTQAGNGRQGQI